MKRYIIRSKTGGELTADIVEYKTGDWVRYSDVEAIIEERDQALALTERFNDVVTAYRDALEASVQTTRQVWRDTGRESAVAMERAERRTRARYRNGAAS